MSRFLRIYTPQLNQITRHARETTPEECCGLLAGLDSVVRAAYPVKNAAQSPETHYEMEPGDSLRVLKQIDRDGLEAIAVYHSHPRSAPIPSLEDVQQAKHHTETLLHLIISLQHGGTKLQAWEITDGEVNSVELLFNQENSQAIPEISRAQRIAILLAAMITVFILLAVSITLLPPAPVLTPVP